MPRSSATASSGMLAPALSVISTNSVSLVVETGDLGRQHPVDRARADRRGGAEAVAVHNLALEHIGRRGKPDVRMRPHVNSLAGAEHRRPEMVEEDEWSNQPGARRGQGALDHQAVDIHRARDDDPR